MFSYNHHLAMTHTWMPMVVVNFLLMLLNMYTIYNYLKQLFDLSKCELRDLLSVVTCIYVIR